MHSCSILRHCSSGAFSVPQNLTDRRQSSSTKNRRSPRCRVWSVEQSEKIVPFLAPDKSWSEDESHIDVQQDRDCTCHATMRARIETDPHTIFELFERPDYDNMFEIFRVVRSHEVITDDGQGKKEIDLNFDAKWSFWKVSGTCFIPISMKMNKSNGKIAFDQKQPGFLTVYKGCWKIMALSEEGLVLDPEDFPWYIHGNKTLTQDVSTSSLVSLELTVKPSIIPPPPIHKLLKGNTADQVESLFRDLKVELYKGNELDVDSILRGPI